MDQTSSPWIECFHGHFLIVCEKEDKEQSTRVDWEKSAAAIALCKLCAGMDFNAGNFTELKNELESSLADIIIACIQQVGAALMDNCRAWYKYGS